MKKQFIGMRLLAIVSLIAFSCIGYSSSPAKIKSSDNYRPMPFSSLFKPGKYHDMTVSQQSCRDIFIHLLQISFFGENILTIKASSIKTHDWTKTPQQNDKQNPNKYNHRAWAFTIAGIATVLFALFSLFVLGLPVLAILLSIISITANVMAIIQTSKARKLAQENNSHPMVPFVANIAMNVFSLIINVLLLFLLLLFPFL